MNLAIIPARGGSKRIPGKNSKSFLGRPIITYSIEAALNSGLFKEVMVSTDDDKIAEISTKSGAIVPFRRSFKNADDFATTANVIEEVLITYAKDDIHFQNVCCIYPTAPFITVEVLKESFQVLLLDKVDSVFPVQQFDYPIWRSFNMNDEGSLSLNFPENLSKRSQDLPSAYHDAGQFYWLNVERFLETKAIFTKKSKGIVVNALHAHDIDTLDDWKMAEFKYQFLKENNDRTSDDTH